MSSLRVNFVDTAQSNTHTTAAGVLTPLSLVSAGYGDSSSLASSVRFLKLDVNLWHQFQDQATATPTGVGVRQLLVFDKQPNASTPTISDTILQTYSGSISAYLAHPNFDNDSRFIVLDDETVDLVCSTADGAHNSRPTCSKKFSFDLEELERTVFEAGGTNVISGALYLIHIASFDNSGVAYIGTDWSARLWYKML